MSKKNAGVIWNQCQRHLSHITDGDINIYNTKQIPKNVRWRQIIWFVLEHYYNYSYPELAVASGYHRATVKYGSDRIKGFIFLKDKEIMDNVKLMKLFISSLICKK